VKVLIDEQVVVHNAQVGMQGPPGPPGTQGADGAPGPAGADGSNVVWRGAWDVLAAYQELDGVQHGGSAWVAGADVLVGDEPGVAGTWGLWVSKGDTGPAGEKGAAGDAGPQGDPGEAGAKGDPGEPGAAGVDGADGREVELQKSATHIQWRYEGEPTWTDLVALADLEGPQGPAGNDGAQGAAGSDGADGREVELQVTATHIQWRLTGGSWLDLVALSELEGPAGQTGAKGDKGDTGAAGAGVPAGGAAGQVLKKSSGADYATAWEDESSGGGSTVAINAQTGTTYTLVLADAGKLVTLTNGSAITLTVPTNASVAYPVGTVIALAQLGAGLVSIAGASGVTINGVTPGDDDLAGQWATASLTKLDTNTWLLSGGLA